MNQTALAKKLRKLTTHPDPETFIFDMLLAYGLPKSSVTLLKNGPRNMLEQGGEVSMKRKLFFRVLRPEQDPLTVRDEIREHSLTDRQRFVVLTDYDRLYAYDTKLDESLDCDFTALADHYDFFLPWAGIEKTRHHDENPADVKAAGRMAKLFDLIKQDNPDESPAFNHDLNVFFSRLLFCFFAEDTGIFPGENKFTNGVASQTEADAHDLPAYLTTFFRVLNLPDERRAGFRAHFLEFPYVNGGLFHDEIQIPKFSARSRRAIIDAGLLDWSGINPDIFGSMIQAVVDTEKRGGLGMHYTSVPNIMKVIEPLFLNDLRENFTKARGGRYEKNDLKELRERIGRLKIFDPACGSGNFLIIAYKELRRLEMEIIQRQALLGADAGAGEELFERGAGAVSVVSLDQFYGIEIDDFAHEIAILALWLAEHQMNADFERVFGQSKPTLPLEDSGNIVHGNACRVDWEEVCPKGEGDETYILGNPPYLGSKMQNSDQRSDMKHVFAGFKKYKDLDLISCWFFLGGKYISAQNAKLAFVSTNSVCQGQQVELLWPKVFDLGLEICLAHQSFVWKNSAKSNAGVFVIIVGLANKSVVEQKRIFSKDNVEIANHINAYLVSGSETFIKKRTTPLSSFPDMSFGNMANDGGGLIFDQSEYDSFIKEYPELKNYVRRLFGASEYIRGNDRYCLWIDEADLEQCLKNAVLKERIEISRKHRLSSVDKGTNSLAKRAYQFRDLNTAKESSIIIPRVSSIRREYIPSGILPAKDIISDNAQAIFDPPVYLLSIVLSKIHMAWVKAIAGKLKSDYRYSKGLVYNTFPFPPITPAQESTLTTTALGILAAREQHPGSTLAELYDPDKMPENLRAAHRANDLAVEACYRAEPFGSDEERLAWLFGLYEEMVAAEKVRDGLFAAKKKGKK